MKEDEVMSLSLRQQANTRNELKENLDKSGLVIEKIAADLSTDVSYIKDLFRLNPRRLEDTWILQNYLIKAVKEKGEVPAEFTALVGDWHDYWFLNGSYIDRGQIGR